MEHILCTIFYKFCWFLTLPVLLVCVYDGADRPAIKRGRKVDPRQLESIPAIKVLAEGFGYKNHDVCMSFEFTKYNTSSYNI